MPFAQSSQLFISGLHVFTKCVFWICSQCWCFGFHSRTSLVQEWPINLILLSQMFCVMRCTWPKSIFIGCCFQGRFSAIPYKIYTYVLKIDTNCENVHLYNKMIVYLIIIAFINIVLFLIFTITPPYLITIGTLTRK